MASFFYLELCFDINQALELCFDINNAVLKCYSLEALKKHTEIDSNQNFVEFYQSACVHHISMGFICYGILSICL